VGDPDQAPFGEADFALPLTDLVAHQQETNGVIVLPILQAHVLALDELQPHHRDPFDRLLVAQALVEGALLVSVDPALKSYPIEVRW
jgi:PIN domain nuclease of toxin-antitoxin system